VTDGGSAGAVESCRTVLVTGASSGIGLAIARRFAASGARVVAAARRADRLHALEKELGAGCLALELDVSAVEAATAAIRGLPAPFDRVDVLVNAAGVALGDAPAFAAEWEHWRQTIETNTVGLAAVTHALLPQMLARGFGDIVNIGSIAGSYPYPKGHVYGATKAFVHQFTLNLRADLAGTGVRAICIEPGTTETEFAAVRLGHDPAKASAFYGGRRLLKPEDVADVVHFAVGLPRHVNLNVAEIMPTDQAFSFFRFAGDP
jgi:3-hydroxy acid dehydrogenase/malonic semialdehyde reductase